MVPPALSEFKFMMASWHGHKFSVLVALGDGNSAVTNGFPHHDDVIKSKHFPRYWPFVQGIHSPVTGESPSQRPVTRIFDV